MTRSAAQGPPSVLSDFNYPKHGQTRTGLIGSKVFVSAADNCSSLAVRELVAPKEKEVRRKEGGGKREIIKEISESRGSEEYTAAFPRLSYKLNHCLPLLLLPPSPSPNLPSCPRPLATRLPTAVNKNSNINNSTTTGALTPAAVISSGRQIISRAQAT